MISLMQGKTDPYKVPKNTGIFQMLESPKDITTTSVAQRIIANHEIYMVTLSFSVLFSANISILGEFDVFYALHTFD